MKILVFGTICAGKSTIAKKITNQYPGFDFLGIDDFRLKYSDGTKEGEEKALKKFIEAVDPSLKNQVIEGSGFGQTGLDLFDRLLETRDKIFMLILKVPSEMSLERRKKRKKTKVPFPWEHIEIERMVERFNMLIEMGDLPMRWSVVRDLTILQCWNRTKKETDFILNTVTRFIEMHL